MIRYPGGTALDRFSEGYSFSRNFLSDLGMTVAYDGQPNAMGALLFFLSLSLVILGLGGCLIDYVRLYAEPPRARGLAWAGGGVGVIVCGAFIGVAVTPENEFMSLHITFTQFAFRLFPMMGFFLTFASLYSSVLPRRVAVVWAALTLVLVGYAVMLEWGPSLMSPDGLTIQVVVQKIVAFTALGIFVFLSVEADRVLATLRAVSAPRPSETNNGAADVESAT